MVRDRNRAMAAAFKASLALCLLVGLLLTPHASSHAFPEDDHVAHLRSGTLTTSGSVLPPRNGKDLRWVEVTHGLRTWSAERGAHGGSLRRGRAVLLDNNDTADLVPGCAPDLGDLRAAWWRGGQASQVVVALSGEDTFSYLERSLAGRGAIADVLSLNSYLVVAESAFLPELGGTLAERNAVIAPLVPAGKISPEMGALLEVLEATDVGGRDTSTGEEGGAAAASSELIDVSPTVTVQVTAKGADDDDQVAAAAANATSFPLPTKAIDIRLKGPANETVDFFSAAVDASGRVLLSVSTPAVVGLEAQAVRDRLAGAAERCGFEILVSSDQKGGGRGKHLSFRLAVPREGVRAAVLSASRLDFVNWIEPELEHRVFNHIASEVLQIGSKGEDLDAGFYDPRRRPFWARGWTGDGEVVGVGDTGLDTRSCFFYDPDHDVGAEHAKVIGYRGFADYEDTSGHGTHVCGSIAGKAYNNDTSGSEFNGMAPDAKVAFTDLGLSYGDQRGLIAPETMDEYYEYGYGLGARIHSDSWGGLSTAYTRSAREVDEWHFYRPEFLAVIAAGNDGEFIGVGNVQSTVSTPATCKNALAVGATLSSGRAAVSGRGDGKIVTFRATPQEAELQAVSSLFSPSFKEGDEMSLVALPSSVAQVCEDLAGTQREADVKGKVVLVERGGCYFFDKIRRLGEAGAKGALVYNNEESGAGFFKMASSEPGQWLDIPAASVPMSTGRRLLRQIESFENASVQIVFGADPPASYPAYESVADYSSYGPTRDGRIKPDVVAPGDEIKSATAVDSDGQCKTDRISGTSMATPLVAGTAAIVRQYIRAQSDGRAPTGALLKAILINGAEALKGGDGTGLPLEPAPSFRQGWGRVQLDNSIPLDEEEGDGARELQFVDWRDLRGQGDSETFCVSGAKGEVRATLAWMDAPGSLSGGGGLVNDLDLRVEGHEGQVDWGAAPRPDRTNNVERATFWVGEAGARITVTAHTLQWPMGNGRGQLYALAAVGPRGMKLGACEEPKPQADPEGSLLAFSQGVEGEAQLEAQGGGEQD